MFICMDAMIHFLLHAAALANSRWLDRRAVPENVSTSKASRSIKPRSTRRKRMVRYISPFSFLTNFHLYTDLEDARSSQ